MRGIQHTGFRVAFHVGRMCDWWGEVPFIAEDVVWMSFDSTWYGRCRDQHAGGGGGEEDVDIRTYEIGFRG